MSDLNRSSVGHCEHCTMPDGQHESGCPIASAKAKTEEDVPAIFLVYLGKRRLASFYNRGYAERAFVQLVNANCLDAFACEASLMESRKGRMFPLRQLNVVVISQICEAAVVTG